AVEVAPRDADARHNLRVMGAGTALARVQPLDWLNWTERALLASVGWWLLLAGMALTLPGSRRRWSPVLPGAAILAVAAAAAVVHASRPILITPLGEGTRLYAAPTTRDAALGDLTAGAVARLVEQRTGWLRVRTEQGSEAWVERSAVAAP
ncbi:MAG: SH3 domain-containing protein, partial [Longimicrobiales bacterium]